MTKMDLATEIVRQLGGSKKQACMYIDAIIEGIKVGMKRDGQVKLSGLGTFWASTQKPRTITHPVTREKVYIDQKKIPIAKFSDEVKDYINQ